MTVQESVDEPPAAMFAGVAANVTVGNWMTVTVACAVDVPPGPVAVSVNVVVSGGVTLAEPLAGRAPRPLSIVMDVAFVTDHVSVDDWPALTNDGEALKEMLGPLLTVTVAWLVSVPPGPVAVRV